MTAARWCKDHAGLHGHCPSCRRCMDEGEARVNIPDALETFGVKAVCTDCARDA